MPAVRNLWEDSTSRSHDGSDGPAELDIEVARLGGGIWRNWLALSKARDAFVRSSGHLQFPAARTLPNISFRELWHEQRMRPPSEFYDQHADSFNSVFYAKNLLKCLIGLACCPEGWLRQRTLADLGAGAGPMSLACNLLDVPAHALLIDRCAAQLAIARQVFDRADMGKRISTFRMQIPNDLSLGSECTPVASYWCLEANAGQFDPVGLLEHADRFFVIDTPKEIERLRTSRLAGRIVASEQLEFKVSGRLAGMIEGAGGKFGYICGER